MLQLLLFIIVILAIIKNSFSSKTMRFTCNNFLLNAYLYIFLSFLLIAFSIDMYQYLKVPSLVDLFKGRFYRFVMAVFFSVLLLIVVMSWPSKHVVGKHAAWITWIATMGYFVYPLKQKNPRVFEQAKVLTFAIMAALTGAAFTWPSKISLNWGSTLFVLLLGLIIVHLVGFFYPYTSTMHYLIIYAGLLLFSFFMLYDTKLLIVKAKECVKADYINDSLGVFLDGMNIFVRIFSVQGR